MPEPYELRSINPGASGPNDPEGPTCECGNILPLGEEPQRCADADCRDLGCEECQTRCEVCGNVFCLTCTGRFEDFRVCRECGEVKPLGTQ